MAEAALARQVQAVNDLRKQQEAAAAEAAERHREADALAAQLPEAHAGPAVLVAAPAAPVSELDALAAAVAATAAAATPEVAALLAAVQEL